MCAYLEDMAFLSFLEIGDLKVTIFLYLLGGVKAKPNLSRYSLSSPNPPHLFRSVCAMLEADCWGGLCAVVCVLEVEFRSSGFGAALYRRPPLPVALE